MALTLKSIENSIKHGSEIMCRLLPVIAIATAPKESTVAIILLLIIAVLVIIWVRTPSSEGVEPFREYDFSLSASQRKEKSVEKKKKYTQKCFDETIRLLKMAIIKKTYRSSGFLALCGDQSRTIYTIPLNRKEAVMYIWGKVIASASSKEQARVIRMAAIVLSILEENKNKHILELEAQAIACTRIYGSADGESKLQIRAVDNVDCVKQKPIPLHFGLDVLSTAEKTEFLWPSAVVVSVRELREFSLLAISESDLYDYTVFPCSVCKTECSIFELDDLKCPNCRKK